MDSFTPTSHETDRFQIEKYGLNSVNVKEVLLELRRYRTGLIQTPEQLRFSYQAIIEGAKQLLNSNSDDDDSSEALVGSLYI